MTHRPNRRKKWYKKVPPRWRSLIAIIATLIAGSYGINVSIQPPPEKPHQHKQLEIMEPTNETQKRI